MDKIRGQFLNMREKDGEYVLDYVNEDGMLYSIAIMDHLRPEIFQANKHSLREALEKLDRSTDRAETSSIRLSINFWRMYVYLPDIYKMYCADGSIGSFFTEGSAQKRFEKPEDLLIGHRPKYELVKEGVDRLLGQLRSVRPEATLTEAKKLYAVQTNETYESVNFNYHHRGKKFAQTNT